MLVVWAVGRLGPAVAHHGFGFVFFGDERIVGNVEFIWGHEEIVSVADDVEGVVEFVIIGTLAQFLVHGGVGEIVLRPFYGFLFIVVVFRRRREDLPVAAFHFLVGNDIAQKPQGVEVVDDIGVEFFEVFAGDDVGGDGVGEEVEILFLKPGYDLSLIGF